MKGKELLEKGITAMSNCKSWFQLHIGATLISAYFIEKEKMLTPRNSNLMLKRAEDMAHLIPGLLSPVNPDLEDSTLIQDIINDLEDHVEELCFSGHRIIFSSLLLKALKEMPQMCCPAVIEGYLKIAETIVPDKDKESRYGENQKDWREFKLTGNEQPGEYSNFCDLAKVSFETLHNIYPNHESAFFLGEKLHTITFAKALIDLDEMGYHALAKKGLSTHRKHLILTERMSFPYNFLPLEPKEAILTENYWENLGKDEFHAVKLQYAALPLLDLIDQEDKKNALNNLAKFSDERIRQGNKD